MTTSNSSISSGTSTVGTIYGAHYNPHAPRPQWHQDMELATVCVCNSLSCKRKYHQLFNHEAGWKAVFHGEAKANSSVAILIVGRIVYRWSKTRHFRYDDAWMAIAGVSRKPSVPMVLLMVVLTDRAKSSSCSHTGLLR